MSTNNNTNNDGALRKCLLVGLKDGALAALASTLVIAIGGKRIPLIRDLTPQAKFATITIVSIATGLLAAEHSLYYFYRPHLLERGQQKELVSWAQYLYEHRNPIVIGTFATTLIGGLLITATNTHKSNAQKFMNMRLYAQAAGFAALFGTIGLGVLASQQHLERPTGTNPNDPNH